MKAVTPLPDLVRATCKQVCQGAGLVRIDFERLAAIGSSFKLAEDGDAATASLTAKTRPDTSTMERSALLVFALDSINFGSGYHDIIDKRPGLSGARTMEASLREFEGIAGPLTPDVLRTLSAPRCTQIFRQRSGGAANARSKAELMALFAEAFETLASWLDLHDGQALCAIEAADGSAVALATMLTAMPFYQDVAVHQSMVEPETTNRPAISHPVTTPTGSTATKEATVHFYKRAQITPADLQRELRQDLFSDLGKLTAFADNLVPHALRVDGAIVLDRKLEAAIDRGELLAAGSIGEVEIRAAGIEAVRQLSEFTGRTEMDLDLALWTRGGTPRYKQIPRHRCRTVFY